MLGYDYKINGGVLKIRRNNPGKTLEKLLEEISKRKNISKIKEFNLQKCFIGRPIEEKYLEKFSHLTCINLSHNTFTDQSFKTFALHFEKLPQLTHLYLEHNHLGNSNLTVLAPHLEKLPNLKCISLRGNPKISAKNAEKLSTQLPNCLVEADSGAYKNGKKIDNILSSGQQAESVEGLSTQLPNCLVEAESEAYKNGKISNTLPSSQQAESYANDILFTRPQ
ncbi:leucine-rich repeat domain-containing protein [Wolbachia endosymbiont of Ctenocephalides felis wCfeT]|uniref:hypothetical protein n=1 Tax=Wolbachia endosymbiont of Ctenocephalides felis wCfeT TaxID=2732593 RepID=UPI001444E52E|nr:hypothetical protein [Wolbachia endosymbiont of Ctenocephalides felis wCfeT]